MTRRPREVSALSTITAQNIAAKRALNKLQIRREEFTARLRTPFEGPRPSALQKDDEVDDRVPK
jgi:hypothetical protein